MNISFGSLVKNTCYNHTTTRTFEKCQSQRHTVFLFVIFCVLRIVSYKFEKFLITRPTKCRAKSTLPGQHVGIALGIPFVARRMLPSAGVRSTVVLHFIVFILSSIAFFPYIKDLFCMGRLVVYAVQRKFYNANQDLILTFVALYIYMSIVLIEVLDVSIEIYCPQHLLGVPLLFPNINFPILLYYLHNFVLMYHKKMPPLVYEVIDEDCFIQLHRMRCICQKDCPELSYYARLTIAPSVATTKDRRSIEGKIMKVRNLRELKSCLSQVELTRIIEV
ncbi:hypothetical protein DICVIV_01227 [Dictyocaulus viviparus]|uniref:Uncharacterized protein n=1 Tax=Dictyocaulus viviparus TaxID=29172 RepID=A0A0D8Y8I4_DICVI|nr:hypothetical protein DICVIV_01227 [Dictyocaulus viviparus]